MATPDDEGVGEAAGEALAAIEDWLATEPHLEPLDEGPFLTALEAFEGASNQRPQLARRLAAWRPSSPASSLRVLSIGCGGGDLDVVVARSLAELAPVTYVGVDPNLVECQRCEALFAAHAPEVEARAEAVPFAHFTSDEAFDLVYAAHTLYYVDDVARAVARARHLLRPQGTFIAIHAPFGALNRLAHPFWAARLGRPIAFSDTLAPHVGRAEIFTIDAAIDATSALDGDISDQGRAIVDFILQLDSARLPDAIQDAVVAYLRAIARRDEAGAWLVPHPTDGFVLRP